MAYESNQAPFFLHAPQLPSRPGHPAGAGPQGSNMLNHTRGFSAGLSVPLEHVTMAGGSIIAGPVVVVSGDTSHQSAFIQALL